MSLGFGYVDTENSNPGSELAVDLVGSRCAVEVLSEPVYDPQNDKLRA